MGQSPEGHLPPDLRGRGGIGGGARENRASAISRDAALSNPPVEEHLSEKAPPEPETDVEHKCTRCSTISSEEANFCHKCGKDLLLDPMKKLGIEFTEEDLDQYLFKGYLVKEVKVVGRSLMVRSSLPDDHKQITAYLMDEWNNKPVTQDFWENLRGAASISLCIVSFDGKEIGENVSERVDWMLKIGSALHDMITNKVVLFNRAITEWLSKKDTFLAS
jgi:hypothetical protein